MGNRTGLILLLLSLAACKPNIVASGGLDRVEAAIAPTPAQRPAWDAFRVEAKTADETWNRNIKRILEAQTFDPRAARSAADAAHVDAQRLITAWEKVDAFLTPAQRAALRQVDPL